MGWADETWRMERADAGPIPIVAIGKRFRPERAASVTPRMRGRGTSVGERHRWSQFGVRTRSGRKGGRGAELEPGEYTGRASARAYRRDRHPLLKFCYGRADRRLVGRVQGEASATGEKAPLTFGCKKGVSTRKPRLRAPLRGWPCPTLVV